MLANIAVIILFSLIIGHLFKKIGLPQLLGMLFVGVLIGPFSRDFFSTIFHKKVIDLLFVSDDILKISPDLRTAALIVILIRAGLGINKKSLKQVGVLSIKMGSIPILFEATFLFIASHYLLGLSFIESGILSFTIAAVSPAIIVPSMIALKENNLGEEKHIPTMILAGASIDVIFAITIFGVFLQLGKIKGGQIAKLLLTIPLGIIIGIIFGVILGFLFVSYFKKKRNVRDTKKVIIFMAIAILLNYLEKTEIFPIASLIGIISMGYVILDKYASLAKRLALKFSKIWVLAEIILFVLIGAALDISQLHKIGLIAIVIIIIGLIGRGIGVILSLFGSTLNNKERLFCVMAYTPKATVQAALGAVPLSLGIASGSTILSIAVLSIAITAPLGSVLINTFSSKLLKAKNK